jgi:TRAP-type C4-dicarboxylate transport system substrate-binding protein
MTGRPSARVATVWLIVLASLAGCAPGSPEAPDKAGGDAPVTLTVATPDNSTQPGSRILTELAAQVAAVSSGRLKLNPVFDAAAGAQDFEPLTIDRVRDGTFDLGWVGTRAWDTRGVTSFDPLQAPFLITSYPILDAIMSSDLPSTLLDGVQSAGFVGLGLFPEQLRHPIGFRAPLRSLSDFRGMPIRLPSSAIGDALIRALGAAPIHANGADLNEAIANGSVAGAESSVGNLTSFPLQSILTSNVTFYPKVLSLFMTASRYAALTSTARDELGEAIKATLSAVLESDPEGDALAAFCQSGGHVVQASASDLAGLESAAAPVLLEIEKDSTNRTTLDRIRSMAATLPSGPAVVIQCPGPLTSPSIAP